MACDQISKLRRNQEAMHATVAGPIPRATPTQFSVYRVTSLLYGSESSRRRVEREIRTTIETKDERGKKTTIKNKPCETNALAPRQRYL